MPRAMLLAYALGAIVAAPVAAADWRAVGLDLQIDLRSVQPDGAGFIALLRHTDLASEGLPPPAARAQQHYRFDCRAHTWQGLDIVYFDTRGIRLPGGGAYPVQAVMRTSPGSFPDRIERMVCPTLRR